MRQRYENHVKRQDATVNDVQASCHKDCKQLTQLAAILQAIHSLEACQLLVADAVAVAAAAAAAVKHLSAIEGTYRMLHRHCQTQQAT